MEAVNGIDTSQVLESEAKSEVVQNYTVGNGEIVSEDDQTITVRFEKKKETSSSAPAKKPKTKRFFCDNCPRKFTKTMDLTRHVNNVHLKLKVRVCSIFEF